MRRMEWYSARLLFAYLQDGGGPENGVMERSLMVFTAGSWSDAHRRALDIGRGREFIARNKDGSFRRRAFIRLETLDCLGDDIDGKQVGVFDLPQDRSLEFDRVFHPEAEPPGRALNPD